MEFPSEFRYIYAPFCGDDPSSWLKVKLDALPLIAKQCSE